MALAALDDKTKDRASPTRVVVATTAFGKDVVLCRGERGTPGFTFQLDGGGELPAVLSGMFTTHSAAMRVADQYRASQPVKHVVSDPTLAAELAQRKAARQVEKVAAVLEKKSTLTLKRKPV